MNYLNLVATPTDGLLVETDKERDLELIRQAVNERDYHGWPTPQALPEGNAWVIWPASEALQTAAAAAGVPASIIQGHAVTWLTRWRMEAFTAVSVPAALAGTFAMKGPWAATPADGHGFVAHVDDLTTVIEAICASIQPEDPAG
jgi:hypothetical protein